MIDFELIFVRRIGLYLNFLFCFCSFVYECPVVPAPFGEKAVRSPLNCFYSFLISWGPYFWALYSVLLICLSLLLPIPSCPHYCSFIITMLIKILPPFPFLAYIIISILQMRTLKQHSKQASRARVQTQ